MNISFYFSDVMELMTGVDIICRHYAYLVSWNKLQAILLHKIVSRTILLSET